MFRLLAGIENLSLPVNYVRVFRQTNFSRIRLCQLMVIRKQIAVTLFCCASVCAQPPAGPAKPSTSPPAPPPVTGDSSIFSQAPPEIDAALRRRASEYYQCFVDGQFQKAINYVAEDSKDSYFEVDKTRYRTFKIMRIEYSDNYSKAVVMLSIDTVFRFQGQTMPVRVPMEGKWKFEKGDWYWYVIPRKESDTVDTPFGPTKLTPDNGQANTGMHASGPVSTAQALAVFAVMSQIFNPVVSLNSQDSYSGSMRIHNPAPKPLRIEVSAAPFEGLTFSPTHLEIPAGGSSDIEFKLAPESAAKVTTRIMHHVLILAGDENKIFMQAYAEILPKGQKPL